MIQPNTALIRDLVEVTQADRDAAADSPHMVGFRAIIRAGKFDDNPVVQSFARHRIASLSSAAASGGELADELLEAIEVHEGHNVSYVEIDGKLARRIHTALSSPSSGERAQIVAELRRRADAVKPKPEDWPERDWQFWWRGSYNALHTAADAIERGDHLASLTNPINGENDG